MRARWAFLIAGGVLVLASGLLFMLRDPGRVSVRVLGETNRYRTVLITNGTGRRHHVTAWGEFHTNGTWCRESGTDYLFKVEPHEFITTEVLMPTNRPRRVTLLYAPAPINGSLGRWINRGKALVGLYRSPLETAYIEVE